MKDILFQGEGLE